MTVRYPDTRIEEVSNTLAGVSFPDPYRWLERSTNQRAFSMIRIPAERAMTKPRQTGSR
jgi:hypothetical protein